MQSQHVDQKDQKLKTIFGKRVSLRPSWDTHTRVNQNCGKVGLPKKKKKRASETDVTTPKKTQ